MCIGNAFWPTCRVFGGVLADLYNYNGSPVREQVNASVSQHFILGVRADRAISILSLLFVNGSSNESRKAILTYSHCHIMFLQLVHPYNRCKIMFPQFVCLHVTINDMDQRLGVGKARSAV